MAVLQNLDLLKYCEVNKSSLNEMFGEQNETAKLEALKEELNQSY
jgi:hypothetical protein